MLNINNLVLLAILLYYTYVGASPQVCIAIVGLLVLSVGWTLYEKIDWVHSEAVGTSRHLQAVAPRPERD